MRDLEDGIRLRVVGRGANSVAIRGLDASGRERCIHTEHKTAALVFSEGTLRVPDVVHLTVAATLLDCIPCAFTNVTTLVLIFDHFDFLDAEPGSEIPRFPGVRTLQLVSGTVWVEICAQDIVDVVRVLGVPSPLSALHIDEGVFAGSQLELARLADTVVLGAFSDD